MKRTVVAAHLAAAASVLILAAVPTLVWAHGGGIELNKKEFAGPYEVSLGTAPDPPSIGRLHMRLTVVDRSARAAVVGAEVTVTATGPDASLPDIGPVRATPDPTDPDFYELNTSVDRLGAWEFTVTVDAGPGYGSAAFAIEVKKRSPLTGIITMLTLLAFVSIVGLSVRMFLTGRAKGRNAKR